MASTSTSFLLRKKNVTSPEQHWPLGNVFMEKCFSDGASTTAANTVPLSLSPVPTAPLLWPEGGCTELGDSWPENESGRKEGWGEVVLGGRQEGTFHTTPK